MKTTYGRRGEQELLVRFSASGFEEVNRIGARLFNGPPPGYVAERMCVSRMRGKRRGTRHEGTVVIFHDPRSEEPSLAPHEFMAWAGNISAGLVNE